MSNSGDGDILESIFSKPVLPFNSSDAIGTQRVNDGEEKQKEKEKQHHQNTSQVCRPHTPNNVSPDVMTTTATTTTRRASTSSVSVDKTCAVHSTSGNMEYNKSTSFYGYGSNNNNNNEKISSSSNHQHHQQQQQQHYQMCNFGVNGDDNKMTNVHIQSSGSVVADSSSSFISHGNSMMPSMYSTTLTPNQHYYHHQQHQQQQQHQSYNHMPPVPAAAAAAAASSSSSAVGRGVMQPQGGANTNMMSMSISDDVMMGNERTTTSFVHGKDGMLERLVASLGESKGMATFQLQLTRATAPSSPAVGVLHQVISHLEEDIEKLLNLWDVFSATTNAMNNVPQYNNNNNNNNNNNVACDVTKDSLFTSEAQLPPMHNQYNHQNHSKNYNRHNYHQQEQQKQQHHHHHHHHQHLHHYQHQNLHNTTATVVNNNTTNQPEQQQQQQQPPQMTDAKNVDFYTAPAAATGGALYEHGIWTLPEPRNAAHSHNGNMNFAHTPGSVAAAEATKQQQPQQYHHSLDAAIVQASGQMMLYADAGSYCPPAAGYQCLPPPVVMDAGEEGFAAHPTSNETGHNFIETGVTTGNCNEVVHKPTPPVVNHQSPSESNEGKAKFLAFVEFKRHRVRKYECDIDITPGLYVMVDGDRGRDCGLLVQTIKTLPNGSTSFFCMDGSDINPDKIKLEKGRVLGVATPEEIDYLHQTMQKAERVALETCRRVCDDMGININLQDCEYQFDMEKVSFYFKSEHSIDFRPLVRELYRLFRVRIWMENTNPHVKNVMPITEGGEKGNNNNEDFGAGGNGISGGNFAQSDNANNNNYYQNRGKKHNNNSGGNGDNNNNNNNGGGGGGGKRRGQRWSSQKQSHGKNGKK